LGKRPKVFQHVTDAGIVLHDGETLKAVHVIQGGTLVGRVLFTERDPCVLVVGKGVTVAHCLFEGA
jgi:hypothetical protein